MKIEHIVIGVGLFFIFWLLAIIMVLMTTLALGAFDIGPMTEEWGFNREG